MLQLRYYRCPAFCGHAIPRTRRSNRPQQHSAAEESQGEHLADFGLALPETALEAAGRQKEELAQAAIDAG